jgi:hypothetical protein
MYQCLSTKKRGDEEKAKERQGNKSNKNKSNKSRCSSRDKSSSQFQLIERQ